MKDYSDEKYPDYSDYFRGTQWPALDADEGVRMEYVDAMVPGHAAHAIRKLKRWALKQYATDMDGERYWQEIMRTPLYRALNTRASGQDDFSGVYDAGRGLDQHQATRLLCEILFSGSGNADPMEVVALAQKISGGLEERRLRIVHEVL